MTIVDSTSVIYKTFRLPYYCKLFFQVSTLSTASWWWYRVGCDCWKFLYYYYYYHYYCYHHHSIGILIVSVITEFTNKLITTSSHVPQIKQFSLIWLWLKQTVIYAAQYKKAACLPQVKSEPHQLEKVLIFDVTMASVWTFVFLLGNFFVFGHAGEYIIQRVKCWDVNTHFPNS